MAILVPIFKMDYPFLIFSMEINRHLTCNFEICLQDWQLSLQFITSFLTKVALQNPMEPLTLLYETNLEKTTGLEYTLNK